MRVLVTGAAGFVARYTIAALQQRGHTVVPTDVVASAPGIPVVDLRDRAAVRATVKATQPNACIHLGAISFVPDGDRDPGTMFGVNVGGTVNVLEAFRDSCPDARIVVVSSAQVYGPITDGQPVDESSPLRPATLYAMSKTAADLGALGYARAHRMAVLTARPGNHTGPGQPEHFVVPAFVRQIKAQTGVEAGEIRVGNLDCVRDFTDVRDVAEAYCLLLERGQSGSAYNISANAFLRIGDLLDTICLQAGVAPRYRVDPELYRPTDRSAHLDIARLRRDTGWSPAIPFEQTVNDMLGTA